MISSSLPQGVSGRGRGSLELRLREAESHRLPYAEFLELIFQDELNVRNQRLIARRNKVADFRETRWLENFDFAFNMRGP